MTKEAGGQADRGAGFFRFISYTPLPFMSGHPHSRRWATTNTPWQSTRASTHQSRAVLPPGPANAAPFAPASVSQSRESGTSTHSPPCAFPTFYRQTHTQKTTGNLDDATSKAATCAAESCEHKPGRVMSIASCIPTSNAVLCPFEPQASMNAFVV